MNVSNLDIHLPSSDEEQPELTIEAILGANVDYGQDGVNNTVNLSLDHLAVRDQGLHRL